MGDHLVLHVDRIMPVDTNGTTPAAEVSPSSGVEEEPHHSGPATNCSSALDEESSVSEEEEPLLQMAECRICQEEDRVKDLEVPCACRGSLMYAHRACVQRWCNEKGDIKCEICNEEYTPGYTTLTHASPDDTVIDISGGWSIAGSHLDIHDPRVLAMVAAQRHFIEAESQEYASANVSGSAFCRFAVLMLLALLLLRQALSITVGDEDDNEDDASTYFSLFLLRSVGFLMPCYLMAWAISILQRRRQRQEAAALAASEVAFILQQSGQGRHLQVTIAPQSTATPQQEIASSTA